MKKELANKKLNGWLTIILVASAGLIRYSAGTYIVVAWVIVTCISFVLGYSTIKFDDVRVATFWIIGACIGSLFLSMSGTAISDQHKEIVTGSHAVRIIFGGPILSIILVILGSLTRRARNRLTAVRKSLESSLKE